MPCGHTERFRQNLIAVGWSEEDAAIVVDAADAVDTDICNALKVALNAHISKVPEDLHAYYSTTALGFIAEHVKTAYDDMLEQLRGSEAPN